jgi:alkanesulfonate monooxygenase SsuD/methylene tetrahydromethanopterin reductase-like flavin-dependent oxidoreductase (luciferase family)
MRFSLAVHCVVGTSHDEAMERAHAIYAIIPREQKFDDWFVGFTEYRLVGSVEEVAARLLPYAEVGADRVMIIHILHTDMDSVQLIGERLIPMLHPSTGRAEHTPPQH